MSEKMKWSEAEAVVRAYRAEHGAGDVDVETLARALGTDVAEVRRLASRRRRFADRSGAISAALAFGIVLATGLAYGPTLLRRHPLVASLTHRHRPVTPRIQTIYVPRVEVTKVDRDEIERVAREQALLKLHKTWIFQAPDETL